jgi:hypothetical protein
MPAGGNFLRRLYIKEKIGFVAIYSADPATDVSAVDLAQHKNLTAIHLSIDPQASPSKAHLISYWRDADSEHYKVQ